MNGVKKPRNRFVRSSPNQQEVTCQECATKKYLFQSEVTRRKYGFFCSRLCLGSYRTKHLIRNKAANYKRGSRFSRDYIEVEAHWHPNKNRKGYIFLHRLILEARLGRFLNANEVVHHIDGNDRNNHWNNLEPMTQREHAKLHNNRRNEYGQFTKSN